MADPKTVHHLHTHESDSPVKVRLNRGPSAKYNWEIIVDSKSTDEVLARIDELDTKLTKKYGGLGVGDKAPKGGLN
jgi:hypothetical protein